MEIQKTELTKEQMIIKFLFKDLLVIYNSRSISKVIGITHAGAFKILKRLEKRGIVTAQPIGKAITYKLNFANPITQICSNCHTTCNACTGVLISECTSCSANLYLYTPPNGPSTCVISSLCGTHKFGGDNNWC